MIRPTVTHAVSVTDWREIVASAPPVDDDFADEVERARAGIGSPSTAWPS